MFLCIILLIIFAVLAYAFLRIDSNPLLALYAKYCPNKDKLKGKICWVVGASTGIGEELAYQLAELNCRLILTSTTESKLEEVKQNCLKRSNNNLKSDDVLVLAYDISDFKKNDEAFKQIIDKFGRLDVLVNNAARIMFSKIVDDDMEFHRKLFDINYFANIHISKLAIRHWLATKSKGIIMATSSIGAYSDLPFFSAYTGSKKALQGFYADVSMQHSKDGISVVITAPGPTESCLGAKSFKVNNQRAGFDSRNRMRADRCAELIIIAMANRLYLSWITEQPYLMLTYVLDHFGYQIIYLFRMFNLIKFVEKRAKKCD